MQAHLGADGPALERRALRLIFISACALVAAEALAAVSLTLMLVGTLDIPVHEAAGARAVGIHSPFFHPERFLAEADAGAVPGLQMPAPAASARIDSISGCDTPMQKPRRHAASMSKT